MSLMQSLAVFLPHLVSAPLLPLAVLALTVLTLATLSAADTTVQERQEQRQKEESGESVALTKTHAIGFGFMASLGLLAMWMWSNVLVYASLFTFGLGSFVGIQQCMPGIFKTFGFHQSREWQGNAFAGILVLAWFWLRNSSYAWFLQDILGGFTITLMLKVLKAPSMSAPTLLLMTAFVYDVFFVFVTPYFTQSGESIMEQAAMGASLTVKETIPMLFRVPSFTGHGEAMLGFGDVVLPGILVTYLKESDARLEEDTTSLVGLASSVLQTSLSACSFSSSSSSSKADKGWWSRRWSYHFVAILGYAVGLEMTFVAMMWSSKGQPALLYLVPCTVLPVVVLASRRYELSLLWNGWSELEDGQEHEVDESEDEDEIRGKADRDEKGSLLA